MADTEESTAEDSSSVVTATVGKKKKGGATAKDIKEMQLFIAILAHEAVFDKPNMRALERNEAVKKVFDDEVDIFMNKGRTFPETSIWPHVQYDPKSFTPESLGTRSAAKPMDGQAIWTLGCEGKREVKKINAIVKSEEPKSGENSADFLERMRGKVAADTGKSGILRGWIAFTYLGDLCHHVAPTRKPARFLRGSNCDSDVAVR